MDSLVVFRAAADTLAFIMVRFPLQFVGFMAIGLLSGVSQALAAVEPPLPGEEGPVSPGEAFSLLPGPGEIPAESVSGTGEDEVVTPPPASSMDGLPDIEPLGIPSDGEPMPELPNIPGLVLPGRRPATPGGRSVTPGGLINPVPDLLPLPEMELAKKTLWYKSPNEARRASIAQRKPLLIFFAQMRPQDDSSGSARLNDDLFVPDEFNTFASAKLILTKLQYPVGSPNKAVYSEAKLAALQKFRDYFKVRGFPAVILLDESGREIERLQGYRRISDPRSGEEFSTAHVLFDRLKEAVHRWEEKRRYRQERIDNLTSQGYREWTSRAGSTMMGKLVEATADKIVLKDENGRWRQVLPAQLILFDAEWARRKQAGLLPGDGPKETASAAAPVPAMPVQP